MPNQKNYIMLGVSILMFLLIFGLFFLSLTRGNLLLAIPIALLPIAINTMNQARNNIANTKR